MAHFPVPSNNRDISYAAVGTETDFDTDFPIFDQDDVQVIRTRAAVTTTLTITTDYTVSINAGTGIATVTPTGSILAGDTWRLKGSMVLERTTDYGQRSDWRAEDVNRDFDRSWMVMQEFARDLAAATVAPQTLPLSLANGGTGAGYASVAALFAAIKQAATTTATGVGEIATDAEFIAQTATDKFLVPSNLAARPTFSVHKNGAGQSIASATDVLLTWGTEVLDVGSYFASNAYTPPAGNYVVSAGAYFDNTNGVTDERLVVKIFVGGSVVLQNVNNRSVGTNDVSTAICGVITVNGAQSIEVYARKTGAGAGNVDGTATLTYFKGFKL